MERAVSALQAYHATLKGGGKSKLLEEDPLVSIIISLKKIPNRTIRPYRMYVSMVTIVGNFQCVYFV